jgi:hypothetical protein
MVPITRRLHLRLRRRSLARLSLGGGRGRKPSGLGVTPLLSGTLAAVGFGVSGEVRAVVLVVGDAIAVAVGGCGGRRRIAALPGVRLLRGDLQIGRAVLEAGLDLRAFVPSLYVLGAVPTGYTLRATGKIRSPQDTESTEGRLAGSPPVMSDTAMDWAHSAGLV